MSDFDFSQGYQYTGIILFPLSIFGLLSNLTVVVFLRLIPSLNNPFGSLTISQAVADCGHQFIFVFYYAPCIFLNSNVLYSASADAGFIIMIFYEVFVLLASFEYGILIHICLISHVFISANRFFAVITPLTYTQLFSVHNTRIMIGGFWLFSIVSLIYKFKTGNCSFYLRQGVWMFAYTDTYFCQNVRTFDFFKFITYVAIIGVLDIVTIVKISFLKANNIIGSSVPSVGARRTSLRKRNLQMNLVYQAFFQGSLIFIELITYFVLSPHARNKWEVFLLTSVTWCTAHAMDGQVYRDLVQPRISTSNEEDVAVYEEQLIGMGNPLLDLRTLSFVWPTKE